MNIKNNDWTSGLDFLTKSVFERIALRNITTMWFFYW